MTLVFFINQTTQYLVFFVFILEHTELFYVSFDGLGIKKIEETIS